MKSKITIRELKQADIPAASKLLHKMWDQHADATRLLDSEYIKKYSVESYLTKAFKDPKQKVFVGEDSGKIVALSRFEIEDKLPGMYGLDRMAYFDSLVVDEDYRRRGIADMMVEHRLKIVKDMGIKVAYSKIYSFNKPPQELMRKHGFEDIYHFYYKFL